MKDKKYRKIRENSLMLLKPQKRIAWKELTEDVDNDVWGNVKKFLSVNLGKKIAEAKSRVETLVGEHNNVNIMVE